LQSTLQPVYCVLYCFVTVIEYIAYVTKTPTLLAVC
jgi:hypothetical protein